MQRGAGESEEQGSGGQETDGNKNGNSWPRASKPAARQETRSKKCKYNCETASGEICLKAAQPPAGHPKGLDDPPIMSLREASKVRKVSRRMGKRAGQQQKGSKALLRSEAERKGSEAKQSEATRSEAKRSAAGHSKPSWTTRFFYSGVCEKKGPLQNLSA